jgi:hypothetical protein
VPDQAIRAYQKMGFVTGFKENSRASGSFGAGSGHCARIDAPAVNGGILAVARAAIGRILVISRTH